MSRPGRPAPARPILTAPSPSRSASVRPGARACWSCWATPSARWNATCWSPCAASGGRSLWASSAPRPLATSCSSSATRSMSLVPTTKSTLPASRARPSSMPTATRSLPGTRAFSKCSRAASPVRTVISTAPAIRKALPTGSRNSSTATRTSIVRPTPSTTIRLFRPSSWPT